jgi:FkbM family methyltransferase
LDLAVLKEVFVDREYDWLPTNDPKVIIDLGAHFGDTALYYHARFPNAKIVAVEPSPENFERLVQHTKGIPEIISVQAAVGASDGVTTLNLMPGTLGHSVMKRKESDHSVQVSQLSLATLFQQQKLDKADLIKFDIEGAEFNLFSSIKPEDYANFYIGEIHFDLEKVRDAAWIGERFAGYEKSIVQQGNKNRFILKASR